MQYYIDPVSGYIFRSIKDAVRYIESGEIGRNAVKPKDKDSEDMELKDDIFSVREAIILSSSGLYVYMGF